MQDITIVINEDSTQKDTHKYKHYMPTHVCGHLYGEVMKVINVRTLGHTTVVIDEEATQKDK